jgi:hypothetical protein
MSPLQQIASTSSRTLGEGDGILFTARPIRRSIATMPSKCYLRRSPPVPTGLRASPEAQMLASLSHPNIAALYDVEKRALVMLTSCYRSGSYHRCPGCSHIRPVLFVFEGWLNFRTFREYSCLGPKAPISSDCLHQFNGLHARGADSMVAPCRSCEPLYSSAPQSSRPHNRLRLPSGR